jgi:hypothetical protein
MNYELIPNGKYPNATVSSTLCCHWCGVSLSGATKITYLNGNKPCCDLCLSQKRSLIMKIIADIDGWEKEIDVAPWMIEKGVLFVAICPPFEFAVRKSDLVKDNGITKVQLRRISENKFKYMP